jgi:putative membrane protein
MLPQSSLQKNDAKAKRFIWISSVVVFIAVALLTKVKLEVALPFNVHVFATFNAIVNFMVAILLIAGLITVKQKKFELHKKIMLAAIVLSVLFLVSYVSHHLLAGDTRFGDIDHDGVLSLNEKMQAGSVRIFYYVLLGLHIPLAAIIMPFILFSAYRALIGEYDKHKKLVRITWPIWFFVAVSGVLVYYFIQPYYSQ